MLTVYPLTLQYVKTKNEYPRLRVLGSQKCQKNSIKLACLIVETHFFMSDHFFLIKTKSNNLIYFVSPISNNEFMLNLSVEISQVQSLSEAILD